MDAADLVGAFGHHRQLDDGERRGVGGDDRLGLDDAVELLEQVALDLQVLDDGLDDEVAVVQPVQIVGHGDAAEDRALSVFGQTFAGDLLGEAGIDAVEHGVGACLRT